MRDIYSNVLVKASLKPAARTATANGTSVDRADGSNASMYQDALVVLNVGTVTDGTHTITIEDSDDNSSFATVAAGYLEGDTPPALITSNDETVYETRYTGGKRYVRVVTTVTGSPSTGGLYTAEVVLSNPRRAAVVHP
ncbi:MULTISPECIES: hypothetical protein [Streptomyces]|uniref:Uncharacterized protein n=1 Tax=Streptomyces erythrochromogenes TaxID=285574 RepID=A0ABZ1QEM3_9ACTN|nr:MULTISPECIES: hypothetical protein [Streptomyces]